MSDHPIMPGNPVAVGSVVHVNGEASSIPAGSSLAQLLALLGLHDKRVAVAINRSVVPRSGHATVLLSDGDQIEILEAVGGG